MYTHTIACDREGVDQSLGNAISVASRVDGHRHPAARCAIDPIAEMIANGL